MRTRIGRHDPTMRIALKPIIVHVGAAGNQKTTAWCWWVNDKNWAAGTSRRPDGRKGRTANTWFAASEARRRFGTRPLHIVTENKSLQDLLSRKNQDFSKKYLRSLARNQRAFAQKTLETTITSSCGDVSSAVMCAEQIFLKGATGPEDAYTYGGYTTIENEKATIAFVDASVKDGSGAWSVIAGNDILASGYVKNTGGNSTLTEIVAICEAFEHMKTRRGIVYSDSLSAIQLAETPYIAYKKNRTREMHKALHRLFKVTEDHPGIELRWVKAHSGIPGNHRADAVAKRVQSKQSLQDLSPTLAEWMLGIN